MIKCKRFIWILICCIIVLFICNAKTWYDKHKDNYLEISLKLCCKEYFDMSKRQNPFWFPVRTNSEATFTERDYSLQLPDINYEDQMLILSFGCELNSLQYNKNDPKYKARGQYVGLPIFSDVLSDSIVYIYKTAKLPLMNTDEAGLPPN